ncbi:TonB-dependent receptor [Hyphomonas sp.]|uniref:TonB-dependent receptor n=1 Tax=Hyphomonas sp. TaxID=87 RepID=UPI000C5D7EFB|nr:TonB-dependent receptor [Hyphomonas sp.]MAB10651.1 TonB-dependent receptor [Hyphomonas sp.]MAU65646.1 TonB-dependent receptor [Hyphomonas sp.]
MTKYRDSKCVWLAGASVLAMGLLAPAAVAQEEGESTRTLSTVTVTTQKVEESIQDVPIAVSAFDEEALERLQLTGGPDLVKSIPNVTFTKGNFTGFNFKIRGIGVDSVAQSGDAGVGVHQNDVPLTANRLFEAEFYDVERVEVLRGPQGTLYGRNATGGVFNLITAKPVLGEFQADAELTYGNENTFKAKGMVNLPLGEKAALRLAGSLLQRDGYVKNSVTGNDIDDRDLSSFRATFAVEPTDNLRGWVSYEHFEEDDSRLRAGKQLCKKDPGFDTFAGIPVSAFDQLVTSLGCQDAPLSQSNDRVNSQATLGGGLAITAGLLNGDAFTDPVNPDLRTIESAFDPIYKADQDLITWKGEWNVTDSLLFTYLGSHNESSVQSIEDYNKIAPTIAFNETAGPFAAVPALYPLLFPGGVVSDPELGVSNLFRTFDQSGGGSDQDTHELRLQSDFDGPINFNLGAIKVDFEAIDPYDSTAGYYVLSNSLTALTQLNNAAGGAFFGGNVPLDSGSTDNLGLFNGTMNGDGGEYFRSLSPYRLDSTAVFGETYYQATDNLKFTLGLRYTTDKKEQDVIPTFLFTPQAPGADPLQPSPIVGADPDDGGDGSLNTEDKETTGRFGVDWSPDLGFTDETLIYGVYSKGYKGGGINPPQPAGANLFSQTFDPEFVNSIEIGTKNTLGGGVAQLNLTGFHYDYEGYQITQIINRSSVNTNIDAKIKGLEVEFLWTPADNWLLTANLGILDTEIQDAYGIDVLDRANGRSDLVVLKNASSFANCVVSAQGYATVLGAIQGGLLNPGDTRGLCTGAFSGQEAAFGLDGVTVSYTDSNGNVQTANALEPFEGDAKSLDGNNLPGAPDTTLNLAAEYTLPALGNSNWDMTIRGDYYYQADSVSRIWNTQRDQLDSWSNVNLSILFNNEESGWGVEVFAKNLTDEEVITGNYLTDDSSGLFTNVFLTEPALYGVTVKKSW